jgi:tRNA A-37 threonylcarbamoyl transferase component Bud32
VLGHGGMGAVYKARQKKLDRLVALKIIRPESAEDPAFAGRFNREARTLARLNHPNIVAVHDFGEVTLADAGAEDATPRTLFYFLMEYVDGANLRQLIGGGELQPEQALAIIPQICEALQFAHDAGIVHRDIKPENILLDKQGHVKIADFGLAKLASLSEEEFTLTGTHQVMGTLRYMAPEQMKGSHTVDHRADIYSLGVVFYEMLTGEVPVGSFDPPSKKTGVDGRLDEVVLRAIASDPERRYQQVAEIGSQVSAISSSAEFVAGNSAEPWPGPSTIVERAVGAVAAEVKGIFDKDEPVDDLAPESPVSQEFVTMSRERAEVGPLPDLCMVCGKPTRGRIAKKFSRHHPEWVGILIVVLFVLFFPAGILAAVMLNQEVRMSCPVCSDHRTHWSRLVWFASLGWLLIAAGAGVGLGIVFAADLSGGWAVALGVGGGLIGVALYVIPLVYIATTRVAVESITKDSIKFKRVSSEFARAVTARREQRMV